MSSLVLDTHATVWALVDRKRLSVNATAAIDSANAANATVFVPTIWWIRHSSLVNGQRGGNL